jgi:hypothetical protein
MAILQLTLFCVSLIVLLVSLGAIAWLEDHKLDQPSSSQ